MKLADWLYEHSNMTPTDLRRVLGVNKTTVHRYLTTTRVPARALLERIVRLTDGAVTRGDFADPSPPECSIATDDSKSTPRWVLPWSPDYDDWLAKMHAEEESRYSRPLETALGSLGTRASLTRRGKFLLDGRLSDPKRLVMAANAVRIARGEPPIAYPMVQPIKEGRDDE